MAVEAVIAPMDMRLRSRRERDIVGWTMPNVFVRRHRWLRLRGGTLAVCKQQWFPAAPMRSLAS
jgi:hypothetical protein